MVNKPFWHFSDFVLASYTFGCVQMSDFAPNNHHLREVLMFFFHSKKTAAEAHWELQKVYGDTALSETTCPDWFRRFKDGDFYVDDRPREGKPNAFEDPDVIYYELLKPNETITGERYPKQLMRPSWALRKKRPQYEQRHEKVILQHDNAQLGSPTPPAVFSRYCAVRLLLVLVDDTWSGWSAVLLIWRHRKMAWFVDSLKRWTLLP